MCWQRPSRCPDRSSTETTADAVSSSEKLLSVSLAETQVRAAGTNHILSSISAPAPELRGRVLLGEPITYQSPFTASADQKLATSR